MKKSTKMVSLYVVKHFNTCYLFVLDDMYHQSFLKFWRQNQTNEDVVVLPNTFGILDMHETDVSDETVYSLAERYSRCVNHLQPSLWWYLDTSRMSCGLIPQN